MPLGIKLECYTGI